MLIIVESPAKARTISKIVGPSYQVKASIGHIRSISQRRKTPDGRPLEINGIDIENDFQPIYEMDEDKKKVVSELKKLAKSSKDGILFATDEDREGEAISWHLAEVLKIDPKSVKRLVFHEITKKAILEAIKHPRTLDLKLVTAQKARQVLDKLVGYKLSPVLWKVMNNNHLSAGRVQSPALRLICEREKEIEEFKPESYWEIHGLFQSRKTPLKTVILKLDTEKTKFRKILDNEPQSWLKLSALNGKKLIKIEKTETQIKQLLDSFTDNTDFKVISVDTRQEFGRTKPPFITSTLQQAASSKLGFTPKQTMSIAQKLYEGVNIDGNPTALITYMRTDSTNLSAESLEKARAFIRKNYPDFLPKSPKLYKSKSRNAQEAHEAIRPVDPGILPESLKNKIDINQFKLYDLIWRQMIASQMTDEIRERLTFEVENQRQDRFSGFITWTISAGHKVISNPLSILNKPNEIKFTSGSTIYLNKINCLENYTKPPSRFSPASLIKKLEELGIGRPSTYASIISTLIDRTYAEIKQNIIYPTSLGRRVSDLLTDNFTEVTSSELTANMEANLDKLSRGEAQYKKVLSDFWEVFKKHVESQLPKIKEFKSSYQTTQTDVIDPKYGQPMVLKIGRFGEYYQNPQHPESIYPKNFREVEQALKEATEKFSNQTKNKVCELCQKPLIVRVSKSTLNPYIACPEYKVGNKHTVLSVIHGDCPKCKTEGRTGQLVQKYSRGRVYLACNLDKKICGFTQPILKKTDPDLNKNQNQTYESTSK